MLTGSMERKPGETEMKSAATNITTLRPQAARRLATTLGMAALLALVALTVFRASGISADSPLARDLFGTVLSQGNGVLVVETREGIVDIPFSAETTVRLPHNSEATVADLVEGDRVAVSLKEDADGELVADIIALIPSKTQFRHIVGTVTALSESAITILSPREGAGPLTFNITNATKVRFHSNAPALEVGASVVLVSRLDPISGRLSPDADEIIVIPGVLGSPADAPSNAAAGQPSGRVDIKGVFDGVDGLRNLIIDGTKVKVNAHTKIEGGLAVGKFVEVVGELLADGTPLAVTVRVREDGQGTVTRTRLEGVFQGVSFSGKWIISGVQVGVNASTYTDRRPDVGQRVRVIALLLPNDALLAREIVNVGERTDNERVEEALVALEGTFQGVAENGLWLVGGVEVAVGEQTRLRGEPSVGKPVRVAAQFRRAAPMLAAVIEGESQDPAIPVKRVEIEGNIERIEEDGTLIVNGVPVRIGALTELEGDLQQGAFIKIIAVLQDDGSVAARVVESAETGVTADAGRSNVRIEGTVERVNEDGSLVVNGIRVTMDALSQTEGELDEGASIRVEGMLGSDGAVVAADLKGESRAATQSGTEVKLEGAIESVELDEDGKPASIVVNDLVIALAELTEITASLRPGAQVVVFAVIADGSIVARDIEAQSATEVAAAASRVRIVGEIRALRVDADRQLAGILINGVLVVVTPETEVSGELAVGVSVEIVGVTRGNLVVALTVKSRLPEEDDPAAGDVVERDIEGIVTGVARDNAGNLTSITVIGLKIAVNTRTAIKGEVFRGVIVKARVRLTQDGVVAVELVGREKLPVNEVLPVEPAPTPSPTPSAGTTQTADDSVTTDADSGGLSANSLSGTKN